MTNIANRYQILSELGSGGMGMVYKAEDTLTEQIVAIKLLKPELAEAELIERFRREGEALRKLNHPNIIKMLDAVEENGNHYLVIEYCPDGDLNDLLKQGQLPIERILKLAIEIADALTRAHHLNIIHRDLKPANVLIAEDGTPRLTDFGIAHFAGQKRITSTDQIIGTVDYFAPEIFSGDTPNSRTDIWAFGVMLFEMLTGERPFKGAGALHTIHAIALQPVPDIKQHRADAPPALVNLVYRMLEKDHNTRITSVRHVAATLEDIAHGRTTDKPQAAIATPIAAPLLDFLYSPKHNLPDYATVPLEVPLPKHPPASRSTFWLAGGIGALLILGFLWFYRNYQQEALTLGATSTQFIYEPTIQFVSASLSRSSTTNIFIPSQTPTITPSQTPTSTLTFAPTPTDTLTATNSPTSTATHSATPTPSATETSTPSQTATATPTHTTTPIPALSTLTGTYNSTSPERHIFAWLGKDLVNIQLLTEDFDAVVILMDADGNMLADDDDCRSTRTSCINMFQVPEDGVYTIVVDSYASGSGGDYTLEITYIVACSHDVPFAIVTSSNNDVNLRRGSGTGYAIVGNVRQGDCLVVIGHNRAGTWLQIRTESGRAAWINANLVDVFGELESVPVVDS